MKIKLVFITCLLLKIALVQAQDLMDLVLADVCRVIDEEPHDDRQSITMILGDIENYSEFLKSLGDSMIDTSIVKEILSQEVSAELPSWKESEISRTIIVKPGDKLDLQEVSNICSTEIPKGLNLEEQVKGYNDNSKYGLKLFPVSVSRPLFSKNGKVAIASISIGNHEARMSIYKYQDDRWGLVGNLIHWIY